MKLGFKLVLFSVLLCCCLIPFLVLFVTGSWSWRRSWLECCGGFAGRTFSSRAPTNTTNEPAVGSRSHRYARDTLTIRSRCAHDTLETLQSAAGTPRLSRDFVAAAKSKPPTDADKLPLEKDAAILQLLTPHRVRLLLTHTLTRRMWLMIVMLQTKIETKMIIKAFLL